MIIHKLTFKDLPPEKEKELLNFMVEFNFNHDLEIYETDSGDWDEHTKELYKKLRKSKSKFNERIFKIKHKIK
jgi:hypothetical protein